MAVLDGYGGRLETDAWDSTGSPVVKGTTVKASEAIRLVLDGYAWEVIRLSFPHLTKDDIRACLEYAADECRRVKGMVV